MACLVSSRSPMGPVELSRIDDALRAARSHLAAGEIDLVQRCLDLLDDTLDPIREEVRMRSFNAEFENWR